jgi:TonB family protein
MMFRFLFVLGLLFPISAWAVDMAAPQSAPAASNGTPQAAALPAGKIRNCNSLYPAEAARAEIAGTTLLSFRLTTEGEVRDVAMVKSSGNKDLDQASIDCANNIYMKPATENGKPIEIVWTAEVRWPPHRDTTLSPASPNGERHGCNHLSYPSMAVRQGDQGMTGLSFHIEPDGSVKDVIVVQSSGHSDLDQATVDCVSKWRYYPATQSGQAVEIDDQFRVRWSLYHQ